MSGAESPVSPIESRADLIEAISSGEKPRSAWRVGTEHEKFTFYNDTLAPVPYEGARGIRAILEGMCLELGATPITDGEAVIGLDCGAGAISLEPGGQFELSGAPLASVHDTAAETE